MAKKKPTAAPTEAPKEAPAQGATRAPPAHTCIVGRIKGTVWANRDKENEVWYSCTISRSYKDGNNEWKSAHSLGRDDLLTAAEVLRMCWLFIAQQYGSKLDGSGSPPTSTNGNGTPSEEPIPF